MLRMVGELSAGNEDLRARLRELSERDAVWAEEVAKLRAELARRDGGKPPSWAKPSVRPKREPEEAKPRKKRSESFVRHREEPTRVVEIGAEVCPDCGRKLPHGEIYSSHQVIEIPETRYEVIEVRRLRRYCGACRRRVAPPPVPPELAVGRSRIGPRLMGFIASAVTDHRMPHGRVRSLLSEVYGLSLSEGTISRVLQGVADRLRTAYEGLLAEIQGSPVVHADETGWRENGRNGWLWSLVTPTVRFFHWDPSHARAVFLPLLGEGFEGVLVTDCYSAYTGMDCLHQYCWAHVLREARDLRESHREDESLARWADELRKYYHTAVAWAAKAGSGSEEARHKARVRAETALRKVANRAVSRTGVAKTLGDRIRRHAHELVTFVEHPDVPPDNNAAERAIRSAVVARKVSGGTRSPQGSETKSILLSHFETWRATGLSPIAACLAALTSPTPA